VHRASRLDHLDSCWSYDVEKIKLLLQRGANENAQADTGINALMVASRYRGNVEAVRLLLKKGARPNAGKGVEIRNDATDCSLP
jgi:ankyrin repeat protein